MANFSRDKFTVRVRQGISDQGAGAGFIVDERRIVTCAHVVRTTLAFTDAQPPDEARVMVDFPLLRSDRSQPRWCKISHWPSPQTDSEHGYDIAGLELVDDDLPEGAGPARLSSGQPAPNAQASIFGYPRHPQNPHGGWSSVLWRGQTQGGLVQVDADPTAAIQPQRGYSGSPVIVADQSGDAVAGMFVLTRNLETFKDSYVIPVSRIQEEWDSLQPLPPCPYRGLNAFTAEDAAEGLFVGREDDIADLKRRAEAESLVVVVGQSGIGKSSLVMAGLIPAMRGDGWRVEVVSPGRDPLAELAVARQRIEKGVGRVLLCIDPLEAVFGKSGDDQAADFLANLMPLRSTRPTGRVHVVCVLRSDFLGRLMSHCRTYPDLRGAVHQIPLMNAAQLEQVIVGPAVNSGVTYQQGLAAHIARDAYRDGGLPLLEFALKELWSFQQKHLITFPDYYDIGSVAGALNRYAEQVYGEMRHGLGFTDEQIKHVLLALVRSRGGSAAASRRVVSRQELGPDWVVVEYLTGKWLVRILDGDVHTAELAHETLIRSWVRLAGFVDQDANFQRWRAELEERADQRELLSAERIAEAETWQESDRAPDIPAKVKQLIDDSKSDLLRRISELEEARNRAEGMRLAAASATALTAVDVARSVSIGLAIESLKIMPTVEGDVAVRRALQAAPLPIWHADLGDAAYTMAFSPDDRYLVAGLGRHSGQAGAMNVIDLGNGSVLRAVPFDGPVRAIAFSPDRAMVALGLDDHTACVLDTLTWDIVRRFEHDGPVNAIAFGVHGMIATASDDNSARVFDAVSGELLLRADHGREVRSVAFSRDGSMVATGSEDYTACVLDIGTGRELWQIEHGNLVLAVTFSADGRKVATGSADGYARVFSARLGTELCRVRHGDWVAVVAFSPDSTRVASGAGMPYTSAGSTRVFDASSGNELWRRDHNEGVQALAFNHDGSRLVVGAGTVVRVFDGRGRLVGRLDHERDIRAVAFRGDGTAIASADGSSFGPDCRVWLFSMASDSDQILKHDGAVRAVAFTNTAGKVATGSADRFARLFDAVSGQEVRQFKHDREVQAVALSPDAELLITGDSTASPGDAQTPYLIGAGSARLFETSTGKLRWRSDYGAGVQAVAWSVDGRRIAIGVGKDVLIIDPETGATERLLPHRDPVWAAVFSPDGDILGTASGSVVARSGMALLLDAATGAELDRFPYPSPVQAVAFSSVGGLMAVGRVDGTAHVLDVASRAEVRRFDNDRDVKAIAFSPDGAKIAIACGSAPSRSGYARVFHINDGVEANRFEHERGVAAIAFSHDGERLATGSGDGSARVWTLSHENLIDRAAERLTRNLTEPEWRFYCRDTPYRRLRDDLA